MKKNLSAVSSVARVVAYAMIMLISAGKSFADDPDLAQWRMAMATNGYVAVKGRTKVPQDVRQSIWKAYRKHIGYEGVQMSTPKLVSTNEFGAVYDLPFTTADGAKHNFGVNVSSPWNQSFYWICTESAQGGKLSDAGLESYVRDRFFSGGMGGSRVSSSVGTLSDGAVVSLGFAGEEVKSPFSEYYFVFIDDCPSANWGHPARCVFVKSDLSAFAVLYVNMPAKATAGGADVEMRVWGDAHNESGMTMRTKSATRLGASGAKNGFHALSDGDASNCYALLVSGGYDESNNHGRYWNDICFAYNVLRQHYKLPRANIKVLWASGNPGKDLCWKNKPCGNLCNQWGFYDTNLSDFDEDGNSDINGAATCQNVVSAFQEYGNKLKSTDQLFVFVTDHGRDISNANWDEPAAICLWYDYITDVELAEATKSIKCPVMFALETCYSGGMREEIRLSSKNRMIATADGYDSSTSGNVSFDIWTYNFLSALCGYYPKGYYPKVKDSKEENEKWLSATIDVRDTGDVCNADRDGDGKVSFYEAAVFAIENNPRTAANRNTGWAIDDPKYSESTANLGKKLFMTQYADAPAVVVRDKVLTPTLSPASGSLGYAPCTITAACATSGATIRYTLDGSDPTARSAVYSDGITISEDTIISIRAFKSDMDPSDVVSVSYAVKKSAPEKALITSVSQGDSSSGIVVYWSGGAGTESYDLLRSESTSMSSATTIATELLASTSSYADLTASPGKTYYYQIRSRNKYGTTLSAASQGAFLMLNPPGNVAATVIETKISSATVNISWSAAPGASYYRVYRRGSDGVLAALGSWQTSREYTDTVALTGMTTSYDYMIQSSANPTGANPSGYSVAKTVDISVDDVDFSLVLTISNPNFGFWGGTDEKMLVLKPGYSCSLYCRLRYADGSYESVQNFTTGVSWTVTGLKSNNDVAVTPHNGNWIFSEFMSTPPYAEFAASDSAANQSEGIITVTYTAPTGKTVLRSLPLVINDEDIISELKIDSPDFAIPGETRQLYARCQFYGESSSLVYNNLPAETEVIWSVIGGSGATLDSDGELTAWPVSSRTNVVVQACINTQLGQLTATKSISVSPSVITKQTAIVPPLGGASTNYIGRISTATYSECSPNDWISGVSWNGSMTMDAEDSDIHVNLNYGRSTVSITGRYLFISFLAARNPGKDREMPFKLRWDGGGIDFTIIQREAPYANDPVVNGGATGTITVNSTTDGSVVHYATDGEEPSENSPVLSNSLDFNESTTFAVKAFGEWMQASDTVYTDVVGKGAQWDEVEISFDTVQAGLTTPATRTYKVNETFGDLPSYPKTNGLYFKGWTLHDGSDKLVSLTDLVPSQNAILYAVWSPIEADKPSWVALPWNFKSAIAATMKILDYSTGEYLDPSVCVIGIESGDGECRGSSENGFGDMQSELNGKDGLFVFGVYSRIESGQEAGLRIRIWSKQQGFLSVINDNVPFEVGTVLGSEADPYVVCVETENGTGAPVITFVANGGTGTMANQKVPYGIATGLNKCTFSKEGYSFKEWSGSDKKTYKDQEVVALQAKLTLTAQWTGCVYRVTLDRQGGSGGTESVLATYGDVMPSIEVPIRKACTFDGYYTSTGGNGTQYYTESGTSARKWDKPEELTLYAKWTPTIKPAVDSDSSGKGSVSGGGVVASGKSTTLKAVANRGCVFAGWYDGDGNPLKGSVDYRTTPYNYVSTGEPTEIVAKFATVEEDVASLYLVDVTNCTTEASGVFTKCMVEHIRSLSLPKLAVTGFPTGLKYNDKSMTINGKATNPGVYKITVAATNASVKKPTDATTATFMLTVPNFKDEEIDVDDSYGPYIPGVSYVVNIKTEGCAVSGLPAGFKYDAKTLTISGAPTKPGSYTVTFTKTVNKVKHTATATFTVGNMPVLTIESVGAGSASGAKAYLANAKVSLKATPDKGNVFVGWYDGDNCLSSLASYPYTMPETNTTLTAKFISAAEEAATISATVGGFAFDSEHTLDEANVSVGLYLEWPVAVTKDSATVKVSGLPAGLKFTAKDIMKKGSKTEVEVPANTIYGAPSAATKAPATVKITVTTASKTTVDYTIALTVEALPDWVVGTFNGGDEGATQTTITITSAGKITGKEIQTFNYTYTISSAGFTKCEVDNDCYSEDWRGLKYTAVVAATTTGATLRYTLEIVQDEMGIGRARLLDNIDNTGDWIVTAGILYQAVNWKSEPWKSFASKFANKTLEYDIEDAYMLGTISLKFAATGAVTVKGKFLTVNPSTGKESTWKASGSAVLVPTSYDNEGFSARVNIVLPRSYTAGGGYGECLELEWDGEKFSIDE